MKTPKGNGSLDRDQDAEPSGRDGAPPRAALRPCTSRDSRECLAWPQSNALPASAGVGFKPAAFRRHSRAATSRSASSRSMPKTTWAPAARRTRSCSALRERYALSIHGVGLSIGAHAAARPRASRAAEGAVRPLSRRRAFPSISPGRRMTASISTTCCRCPIPKRRWRGSSSMSTRCRRRSAGEMLLENPSTYVEFADSTIPETEFLAEIVAAHRLRAAARRQQCVRLGDQSRHAARTTISTRSRWSTSARSISAATTPERRRRRAAADRRPRHAGRRSGLGALRKRHRAHRAAADADRMGQRRAGLAGAGGRGPLGVGHSRPREAQMRGLKDSPIVVFEAPFAAALLDPERPVPPGLVAVRRTRADQALRRLSQQRGRLADRFAANAISRDRADRRRRNSSRAWRASLSAGTRRARSS